jgi:hypothetical protein
MKPVLIVRVVVTALLLLVLVEAVINDYDSVPMYVGLLVNYVITMILVTKMFKK